MRSVRIEPSMSGKALLVDVTCSCGQNGLRSQATGTTSFKHPAVLGNKDFVLSCDTCNRTYKVEVQGDHIHVHEQQAE